MRHKNALLVFIAGAAAALCMCGEASARTLTTLYSFCAQSKCADGEEPEGRLLMNASGNIFGTTSRGGTNRKGTVYELIPNADKSAYTQKTLYSFCSQPRCGDGAYPTSGLIMDGSGNLYGVAAAGGHQNGGVAFELVHNDDFTQWTLALLHVFCAEGTDKCTDGQGPSGVPTYAGAASGLPYDGVSPLFGTTEAGGAKANKGVGSVYRLAPGEDGWTETVIFAFNGNKGEIQTRDVEIGLIMDGAGTLYGMGQNDGRHGGGVAYELSSAGTRPVWKPRALYYFCKAESCLDGSAPVAELVMDARGVLLGTTYSGGENCVSGIFGGCGTVFKIVRSGEQVKEKVLYSFCALAQCADGRNPTSPLLLDAHGRLFGTTSDGGVHGTGGTVFELDGSKLTTLYSFCAKTNCRDGARPSYAGLIMDSLGSLYGVTGDGGANRKGGTVYRLSP